MWSLTLAQLRTLAEWSQERIQIRPRPRRALRPASENRVSSACSTLRTEMLRIAKRGPATHSICKKLCALYSLACRVGTRICCAHQKHRSQRKKFLHDNPFRHERRETASSRYASFAV